MDSDEREPAIEQRMRVNLSEMKKRVDKALGQKGWPPPEVEALAHDVVTLIEELNRAQRALKDVQKAFRPLEETKAAGICADIRAQGIVRKYFKEWTAK